MRLIDADALFKKIQHTEIEAPDLVCKAWVMADVADMIHNAPTIDAVSPSVVEQYKWERDTAIAQLEELGIGFGQKKPDMVEVVRCRECIHYDPRKFLSCTRLGLFITDEFFCGVGKKAEEAINDGDLQKA